MKTITTTTTNNAKLGARLYSICDLNGWCRYNALRPITCYMHWLSYIPLQKYLPQVKPTVSTLGLTSTHISGSIQHLNKTPKL